MFSWFNIFLSIPHTCASRKYLIHIICGISLSTPMSYSSVDLSVFSFCFFDILIINPRLFTPIDIFPPVCPRMSSWYAYDVSTHHFIKFTPSEFRISGNLIVRFIYLISLLRFFQSPSSGFLTLVVRKYISVSASFLHRIPVNNNCATTWWNACACVSSSNDCLLSYLMLKRFSAEGVSGVSVISSGKSSITPLRYYSMDIHTSPSIE